MLILVTTNVMEMIMKRRSVMNNVAQVCFTAIFCTWLLTVHSLTEKPYWGGWDDWTVCSKKCGGGISYRKRKCYQSKCPHPYYKKCDGSGYEEKKCNEQCCPGVFKYNKL